MWVLSIYDLNESVQLSVTYPKSSIPDNITGFKEVAKTIDNWHTEIFNYFDYKVTNAFVEGINSTIRAIESQGRGYTFEVLRAKVMFFINHKVEKPSYGSGTFSNILMSGINSFNETKDYGVPFENIIKAISEGLL